ncbi:BtrH N-terminal domain-containing protein [Flavihumibacter profundi]|uniref:BtrH N-terminal domain-containing protein n=1 Tax=Flavihumibacter profundi TaxID=2716883 RepID=UPI001CC6B9BB|nr:BtrH N-terminal domain-containing protein [Flavihumibacter profundi]MBZ5859131.1 BtrH N-terminal domain-containing protein [Flavihumibacter profundi]
MKIENFSHQQSAHCESGVTLSLLRHYGIELTEPLIFGIGAGLFFGHLPFIKVNGVPGTTFRIWPGYIFKRVCKELGITMKVDSFSSPEKGMAALDDALAANKPVGMQSSVYYLSYFPPAFRFHFNGHNLIAYGKENNEYLISDPVMETATRLSAEDLEKARFAKGFPAPNGKMYYPVKASGKKDLSAAIVSGMKKTCFFMLQSPPPFFGYRGIAFLGRRIKTYPQKLDARRAALFTGNIIRMQEEIGTGGAGFRFLYAAFLQEAAVITKNDALLAMSAEMTKIGDEWRNFAYAAARVMKDRSGNRSSYNELGDMLIAISAKEKDFFTRLKKLL